MTPAERLGHTSAKATTDWHPHDGSGCPVDADTFVVVRFRSGWEDHRTARASYWADHEQDHWINDGNDMVIVAYRILGSR